MPLIPTLPFLPNRLPLAVRKKHLSQKKWLEWARDSPHPATIQLPSLRASVMRPT